MSPHRWPRLPATCCVFTLCAISKKHHSRCSWTNFMVWCERGQRKQELHDANSQCSYLFFACFFSRFRCELVCSRRGELYDVARGRRLWVTRVFVFFWVVIIYFCCNSLFFKKLVEILYFFRQRECVSNDNKPFFLPISAHIHDT